MAKLTLTVGVDVNASSLAEAIEVSKVLKETDVVDINGEFMEGSMSITGVYENE